MATSTPLALYKPANGEVGWGTAVRNSIEIIDDRINELGVNVKAAAFGAIGDGSADDTTAFNNARAALPASGGFVYAPPGNYKITAALAPYTEFQQFVGAGQISTKITYTASSGYAFTFGSVSSSSLSYGCGIRDMKILMTNNGGNAVKFAGTAMGTIKNVYIEGNYPTSSGVGVMWDGGNACNIFGSADNVLCNHIKYGHVMDQSGTGYVTSLNARNCTALGDLIAGSKGWDIRTAVGGNPHNGSGSHIIGGNVEACATGIYVDSAAPITWDGVRFEGNTADVYWDTNARANTCIGFNGADTWTNVSYAENNQRIGCTASDGTPLRNLMASIYSGGNLVLADAGSGTRSILQGNRVVPDGGGANAGRLIMQWGGGGATDGGGVILYGGSHASKPGYVVAGLGGSGARRFEVNDSGNDNGTPFFAVDGTNPANTETAMLVRRNVGGSYSLERVSMGATDSGGSGFKVLRVPN